MSHEERTKMRTAIYEHLNILLTKVHNMFTASGDLTVQQMIDASDILKDISKADSALSKACYYDALKGDSGEKRY